MANHTFSHFHSNGSGGFYHEHQTVFMDTIDSFATDFDPMAMPPDLLIALQMFHARPGTIVRPSTPVT